MINALYLTKDMKKKGRSESGLAGLAMTLGKPKTPEGSERAQARAVTLFVRLAPRLFDPSRRVSKAAHCCVSLHHKVGQGHCARSGNRSQS